MNRERRKEIDKIIGQIDGIIQSVDDVEDQEQECFDNLPDGLQDSERGDAMQDAIESLEQARDCLGEAITALEEAKG